MYNKIFKLGRQIGFISMCLAFFIICLICLFVKDVYLGRKVPEREKWQLTKSFLADYNEVAFLDKWEELKNV